jgi:hypothetical protein
MLLGSTINDGCNIFVVLKGNNEEDMTPTILREKTILERRVLEHYMVNVWLNFEGMSICSLDFNYMVNKIG